MATVINPDTQGQPYWKRTLAVILFAQVMTSLGFSSFIPFMPMYVTWLGSSFDLNISFLIGMAYSAQSFAMMVASPVWGNLADRYGRKPMVIRALFGGSLLVGLMGFAGSAEELVALRFLQGCITGVIGAHNALLAAVAPRARIGFVMGMMQVAMGLGVAIGPMMGGILADIWGYRTTFGVTSALLFIAGLFVIWGVKENFDRESVSKRPKVGFLKGWGTLLANRGVATAYVLRFISLLGRSMLFPLIPLLVQSLLTESQSLNTFTGMLIGGSAIFSTLSGVYLGRLGDRIGHRVILIFSLAGAGVFYMLHYPVSTGWQLMLVHILVGASMGGAIPTVSALLARYVAPGKEGEVYGLDNSVTSAAFMVAPMLAVGIAAWLGVRPAFLILGAITLAGGFIALKFLPKTEKPAT